MTLPSELIDKYQNSKTPTLNKFLKEVNRAGSITVTYWIIYTPGQLTQKIKGTWEPCLGFFFFSLASPYFQFWFFSNKLNKWTMHPNKTTTDRSLSRFTTIFANPTNATKKNVSENEDTGGHTCKISTVKLWSVL